jgi:hypothetical protein
MPKVLGGSVGQILTPWFRLADLYAQEAVKVCGFAGFFAFWLVGLASHHP